MLRLDSLSLPLDFTPETLNALILRKLKCPPEQLKSVVPLKRRSMRVTRRMCTSS